MSAQRTWIYDMNKSILISLFTLQILLTAPSSFASVRFKNTIDPIGRTCIDGIKSEICAHFFENQDLTINVTQEEPNNQCKKITLELLQISSRLEAPVPNAITQLNQSCSQSSEFKVHIPALRQETEFEIIASKENSSGKVTPYASLPLKAYPRTLLSSLKKWADNPDNMLIIRDGSGKLSSFLNRHDINFSPFDVPKEKLTKIYLYVGKNDTELKYKNEGYKIYLREKTSDFPLVTVEKNNNSAIATADIKILDALNADDPLAQKTFLKLFDMIAK